MVNKISLMSLKKNIRTYKNCGAIPNNIFNLLEETITTLDAIERIINDLSDEVSKLSQNSQYATQYHVNSVIEAQRKVIQIILERQDKFEISLDKLCDVIFSNLNKI